MSFKEKCQQRKRRYNMCCHFI